MLCSQQSCHCTPALLGAAAALAVLTRLPPCVDTWHACTLEQGFPGYHAPCRQSVHVCCKDECPLDSVRQGVVTAACAVAWELFLIVGQQPDSVGRSACTVLPPFALPCFDLCWCAFAVLLLCFCQVVRPHAWCVFGTSMRPCAGCMLTSTAAHDAARTCV